MLRVFTLLKKNKIVLLIICIYLLIELFLINWGIPNPNHPFTYHMDEWHQSQAVRTVFTKGTPNLPGSANGSLFHFFLTGIYLIPFVIVGIVNPFVIKSSVGNLEMQQKLFEVFRLNTLLFGVLSIILLVYIAKKYFKIHPFLTAFFFVFTPMWLSFSNYFKYDIALVFWILLALLFLLRFVFHPTFRNYLIAGVFSSLALAVKLSAIPLLPVYLFSFFAYFPQSKKNISKLFIGFLVYVMVFIIAGIPDIVLGKGNLFEYLDANLRRSPETASNYFFGMPYVIFQLVKLYPYSFGHAFYLVFIVASIVVFCFFTKKLFTKKNIFKLFNNKAYTLFIMTFLFFVLSLIPLRIEARANRLLVLLPFMAIFIGIFISILYRTVSSGKKYVFIGVIAVIMAFQLGETFGWVWMKIAPDPRVTSSIWLKQHIKSGTMIGVENIPIYQMLPDIVLKEFYDKQYSPKQKTIFNYEVIDEKTSHLPPVVIVSNGEIESRYVRVTPKRNLLRRLQNEQYKVLIQFQPDFQYYNFYGDQFTFYIAGLVIAPNTITIYSKN